MGKQSCVWLVLLRVRVLVAPRVFAVGPCPAGPPAVLRPPALGRWGCFQAERRECTWSCRAASHCFSLPVWPTALFCLSSIGLRD